jgi:hypothetical protein
VYGRAWLAGERATVQRLRSSGARVVVLSATPRPPGDVPSCLSVHLPSADACALDPTQAFVATGIDDERAVATSAGAAYVDVQPWFCDATRCPVVVGNLLVFRDDNHITTTYARWLSSEFVRLLDPIVR